ncbi:TetR/AcrR family transcriptional regulator [Mycobacterium sherrisii]|uniref:TetR family transcriptional regulator n=1 Tax=Mycobacterium sherrisii TaxID=243061 RepID=A0A1E3SNY6_9MYCO|nr:TetR family transcriptional regulator [Mycobacterium sherrisii]MCV7032334.1 TetR family transcriptional regulator [Mycobacterium sherrisii]ODR03867.1 TetR family transcriptional regulator [Mycobacterium sherrisii]ORW74582.1 TetR family transcriptional regulator [Mycobacterium sherrisii]
MARPRKPLISRRRALETALRIIDEKGLDSLSIRGLGEELGVNGASLYHHFSNKEEILVGATELALSEVLTMPEPGTSWRTWLAELSRRYRDALAAHPAVVPVVMRRREVGWGSPQYEAAATRLLEEGVPSAAVMPLLDAVELFILGSALHQASDASNPDRTLGPMGPVMTKVVAEAGLSAEELFDVVVQSIFTAIETAVDERVARWTPDAKRAKA